MNILEFRKKYPVYNDLSDEDLTRALHSKYYQDMPFEEFDKIFRGPQEFDLSEDLSRAAGELVQNAKIAGLRSLETAAGMVNWRGLQTMPDSAVKQYIQEGDQPYGGDPKASANTISLLLGTAQRKLVSDEAMDAYNRQLMSGEGDRLIDPSIEYKRKDVTPGDFVAALQKLPERARQALKEKADEEALTQDIITWKTSPISKAARGTIQGVYPSMVTGLMAAAMTGNPLVGLFLI